MNNASPLPNPNFPPKLNLSPKPNPPKRKARWVRASAWIFGGLGIFLVLIVIALWAVLNSTAFHNYVLNTAQKQASERLGTQVRLQNFALHLSTLSLDIYGLTVHGADPYRDPPLLQMQHAEVGVRMVSILHRKWYLDSIQIDRPVIRVFTDAHGVSNIPKLKSSGAGNNTNLFDLAIRHAMLTNGEVSYNNKQSVLTADLHNVEFRAAFDVLLQKYSGRLSYADGQLASNSIRTFRHGFEANFDATPTIFHLTRARLTSGRSQFVLIATVENYSDPNVQAHYEAIVDGSDLRQILGNPSVPAGVLRASGSAMYHAIANRPPLDALVLNGNLSSQRLDLQTPSLRTQINDLAAQYSLANGDATVQSLRAGLLGGEFTATAKMNAIAGSSHSQLNASLNGVSLAELRGMFRSATTMPREVALSGGLNAQVNAAWGKTFNDMIARADVVVDGGISGSNRTGTPSSAIPLNSTIHGEYTAGNQQLALNQSYIRMPQTTLTMNGVMSKHSNLGLRFQSNDLHELETVADLFRTPNSAQPGQALDLAGTASFIGMLQGSTAAPHLTGQLIASSFRVKGTNWRVLRTNVDLSPTLAALQNGQLQPASEGNISFNASAGLRKWAFTATSPLQVNLDASQLNISELTKVAGSQVPVTGVLSAKVKMHGTERQLIGQGNVSLTRASIYQEPIRSAQLNFSGTGDEVHGNLAVALLAGNLQSTISVRPQAKSYVAQLAADNFHMERLQTLKTGKVDINGALNLHASGQGTFQNPQLDATLQGNQLAIQKQTISGLNLHMNVANHVAIADLSSQAVNTSIRAKATVNLTGDYPAQATLDTEAIPLQPLAAIYIPTQASNLGGQTELHATLNGPLKNKKLLEAHVHIPVLKINYGSAVQLAAVSPLQADYKDGVLSVQRGAIRGTDTDLQFQGSIPTGGNAHMSLLLLGAVNLHLAQLFEPDLRSSGQLKFNINSYGASSDPNVEGQIEIVDANIANGDLPVGLQHGNGVLTLTKDRLNITRFQGIVGSGTVTAQGGMAYRPGMQFDLGLSAKDVRVLYPQGVRESINADLKLSGSTENAILGGTVNLADLSFTPAFDLTNFINQFTGGVAAPPSQGLSQNVQLNLSVRSSNNINLVSRTLSVNGAANLQVRGTAAQPVILGRVNLDSGDLIFNGKRFVLNGGTIQFVNPSETQPVVNLALNTTIQQYNIYMRFNGPINQLRTNYASDPSLPAADIINLLAFGQTTEASAANPSTPANQAAESLVASQVSSQITSRVSKVAGISQLSINPVLTSGSTQGPPGANITVQQRVTGNLFVTFSSNVTSTQNQVIMGQYQVSPRVAVSATRDQNGGFAVDTLIKKTW